MAQRALRGLKLLKDWVFTVHDRHLEEFAPVCPALPT
jgi:hypothetical protein